MKKYSRNVFHHEYTAILFLFEKKNTCLFYTLTINTNRNERKHCLTIVIKLYFFISFSDNR